MKTPEVADRANVSYRQIDHWVSRGYVHAVDGTGSGSERTFLPEEVRVVVDMANLVRGGLTPIAAARIARELQRKSMADLGHFYLMKKVDA